MNNRNKSHLGGGIASVMLGMGSEVISGVGVDHHAAMEVAGRIERMQEELTRADTVARNPSPMDYDQRALEKILRNKKKEEQILDARAFATQRPAASIGLVYCIGSGRKASNKKCRRM